MGKIATHQYVSTFAGGGTLPTDGNMCATKEWIVNNFSNVGINGTYANKQLVQEQHLMKKNLEVTGLIVDGNNIPLTKATPLIYQNTGIVEVASAPFFSVSINIANVGDRLIYPLCQIGGLESAEFTPGYREGEYDTATVLYQDFIRQAALSGIYEATFMIANEQSPNYSEVFAYVYLPQLKFV